MKKNLLTISVFTALFIFLVTPGFAKETASNYEVATWKGFRASAVTYTFDDQCSNQFPVALPLFDALGYKATFYPVINWGPSWDKFKTAAANGHEVGSHTMSHPDLSSSSSQEAELKDSQNKINEQIPGNQCVTIAYPYCNPGTPALISKYYIAGRICSGQIESSTPQNFLNISSIACGDQTTLTTASTLNQKVDAAITAKGWCVFLIHGVDNDGGYSPISSSAIKSNLDYIAEKDSLVWVSTFSNIVRYIKERNAATITEKSVLEKSITLTLTDSLTDSIYNVPITLRRPLPSTWTDATVVQNSKQLSSSIVTLTSSKYIVFDAIPDSGDICITESSTAIIADHSNKQAQAGITGYYTRNSFLFLTTQNIPGTELDIDIIDLKGTTIRTLSITAEKPSGSSIQIPVRGICKGTFLAVVRTKNRAFCKNMLVKL